MIYDVYYLRNQSFSDSLDYELIARFNCDQDAKKFRDELIDDADLGETYIMLERVD